MKDINEFLKDFGQQLKKRRKAMGLSQVNAAHQMKIDYRHYQNIEGGKINLRLDTFLKLIEFYQMGNKERPFDVEVCVNMLSGLNTTEEAPEFTKDLGVEGEAPTPEGWNALYHDFVESGQAGFLSINGHTGLIEQVNDKLVFTLGFRTPGNLINRNFSHFFARESAEQLQNFLGNHSTSSFSKPFVVTLKAQPPAHPIPMMALMRIKRDLSNGEEHLHLIALDRRVLDGESKRVRSLLVGHQQTLGASPQLHAI
jgi:transcriptional regulator with XRE-family HTH domain